MSGAQSISTRRAYGVQRAEHNPLSSIKSFNPG